jgi:hypothetical protein
MPHIIPPHTTLPPHHITTPEQNNEQRGEYPQRFYNKLKFLVNLDYLFLYFFLYFIILASNKRRQDESLRSNAYRYSVGTPITRTS